MFNTASCEPVATPEQTFIQVFNWGVGHKEWDTFGHWDRGAGHFERLGVPGGVAPFCHGAWGDPQTIL